MKSNLTFLDAETGKLSSCGDVLNISLSSRDLDWRGVILEQGASPHFYPKNVFTPYFYFALAMDEELHWSAETEEGIKELKTSPGDIWINPPSSAFSHDIDEPCYFVILAIEERVFLESSTLDVRNKKLRFLNNYNVFDEVVKGIIELFLLEVRGGRNGYDYLKNLLALLSTHYIQHYSNYSDLQNAHEQQSKFDHSQVDRVAAYIDQNMGNVVSVDDLADLLGCSKYYFLREFKKLVGITPYQFLMKKRLERAEQLLKRSKADIASISIELGFNDQSHFSRAFKKHTGVSPGQFQRKSQS